MNIEEFITCPICGHKGKLLAKHYKAEHNLSSEEVTRLGYPKSSELFRKNHSERMVIRHKTDTRMVEALVKRNKSEEGRQKI